jgi:carboxymethylenebutenolidase
MDRPSLPELEQEIWNLFDRYEHGDIDRRGFFERAARLLTGGLTAAALLDALLPASP